MISLAISSYCPKLKWLLEALESATGFDEIVLYCRGGRDRFAEQIPFDVRDSGSINRAGDFEPVKKALDEYIAKNPQKNIRFYTDTFDRMGYEAMNYAVSLTKGEWVIPFSDDDRFIHENLFTATLRIRNGQYDDADVLFSHVTVNDNSTWGGRSADFSIDDIKADNLVPFSSFVKRESFFKAGGYLRADPILDWGLWLRMKMLGMTFKYFEKPIYDYRFTNQATLNVMNGRFGDMANMRQMLIKNAEGFVSGAFEDAK